MLYKPERADVLARPEEAGKFTSSDFDEGESFDYEILFPNDRRQMLWIHELFRCLQRYPKRGNRNHQCSQFYIAVSHETVS